VAGILAELVGQLQAAHPPVRRLRDLSRFAEKNADPLCGCISGFSLASPEDWGLGDRSHGCSRNTPLDCENEEGNTNSTGLADKFYPVHGVRMLHERANKVPAAATGGWRR
jgi:hypothetical protein